MAAKGRTIHLALVNAMHKKTGSVALEVVPPILVAVCILLSGLVCLYQFLDCIDKCLHCILRKK